MEVSMVRRRLLAAIDRVRERAAHRRQQMADAERAYAAFLERVAVPVTRMMAMVLKAEGYSVTVFTPTNGLRLALDRGRDDFVEFALDTDGDQPQVMGRMSYTRGSRTLTEERPVKPGALVEALSEEDVVDFLTTAVEPWLR